MELPTPVPTPGPLVQVPHLGISSEVLIGVGMAAASEASEMKVGRRAKRLRKSIVDWKLPENEGNKVDKSSEEDRGGEDDEGFGFPSRQSFIY